MTMTGVGRAFVLLLLLIAGCSRVRGEPAPSPQLRAAYCLAVAKTQEAKHEDESRRAGSAARDSVALALRMARERRARLERYLERNGIAPDDDDLSAARERGVQDVEDCDRESKLAPYKPCNDQCMTRIRAADQQIICMMSCPSPEACQRVKACLDKSVP